MFSPELLTSCDRERCESPRSLVQAARCWRHQGSRAAIQPILKACPMWGCELAAPLCGAVEAGGTKFVCMVGTGPADVREQARFATTTPDSTLRADAELLLAAADQHGPLAAIGIASFGPVDLHPGSPTFGFITSTPKPGWANVDIAGAVRDGAARAGRLRHRRQRRGTGEWRWGAAQGLDTFIYLTVGTGIGGGGLVNGRLMHGLVHPEMGHVRIPHDRDRRSVRRDCPFHGDCLEGLASGPAMNARWLQPAEQLPPDHPGWALEARYLALALVNFICTLSPQRIVIGGGVMSKDSSFRCFGSRCSSC